jgi:DNA-binding PadR family transcriptional regulator
MTHALPGTRHGDQSSNPCLPVTNGVYPSSVGPGTGNAAPKPADGLANAVARSTVTGYILTRYMADSARALSPQVFQILLSLADRPQHGYAIILDVQQRTGRGMRLTASTLYAALKRLLDAGLIEEIDARADDSDPRRRYYRLTKTGQSAGRAEAVRLDALTAMARAKRWLPSRRSTS